MKFQSSLVIETLSREINLGGVEASGDNLKTKLTPQTPTDVVFGVPIQLLRGPDWAMRS